LPSFTNLKIELHDEKSKITQLKQGINFLGFRDFYYYRILKKDKRKFLKDKLDLIVKDYRENGDYELFLRNTEAIVAHIENANTFNLRKNLVDKITKYF
jgi:hypothetical protein